MQEAYKILQFFKEKANNTQYPVILGMYLPSGSKNPRCSEFSRSIYCEYILVLLISIGCESGLFIAKP